MKRWRFGWNSKLPFAPEEVPPEKVLPPNTELPPDKELPRDKVLPPEGGSFTTDSTCEENRRGHMPDGAVRYSASRNRQLMQCASNSDRVLTIWSPRLVRA